MQYNKERNQTIATTKDGHKQHYQAFIIICTKYLYHRKRPQVASLMSYHEILVFSSTKLDLHINTSELNTKSMLHVL